MSSQASPLPAPSMTGALVEPLQSIQGMCSKLDSKFTLEQMGMKNKQDCSGFGYFLKRSAIYTESRIMVVISIACYGNLGKTVHLPRLVEQGSKVSDL